jgi:hypothetical protein
MIGTNMIKVAVMQSGSSHVARMNKPSEYRTLLQNRAV